MGRIENRLAELGLELPLPEKPVANYVGCKQSGNLLFVSALVSATRGAAGMDMDLEGATAAAASTVLGLLSIVRHHVGDLDRIAGVEKMRASRRILQRCRCCTG